MHILGNMLENPVVSQDHCANRHNSNNLKEMSRSAWRAIPDTTASSSATCVAVQRAWDTTENPIGISKPKTRLVGVRSIPNPDQPKHLRRTRSGQRIAGTSSLEQSAGG